MNLQARRWTIPRQAPAFPDRVDILQLPNANNAISPCKTSINMKSYSVPSSPRAPPAPPAPRGRVGALSHVACLQFALCASQRFFPSRLVVSTHRRFPWRHLYNHVYSLCHPLHRWRTTCLREPTKGKP